MSRYGVQVSQQGIDISRAADYQKVLDSGWRFLDVALELNVDVTVSVSSGAAGYRLFSIGEHNLGFVPAFEFIVSSTSGDLGSTFPLITQPGMVHSRIRADKNMVTCYAFFDGTNAEKFRVVGKLRVFSIPVLEEYQAESVPVTTVSAQLPSRYGAKFLDLNRGYGDIEDETMYPFTLNTRGKQISVHKHGTAYADAGTSYLLNITHNMGYPPTYMVCKVEQKSTWASSYQFPYNADYVTGGMVTSYYLASVTPTTITFQGVQSALSGLYAYIILKDPTEIAG